MRTRLDLFVLLAFAVYRTWRLVARDKITERWREQLYNRWPPDAARAAGLMTWEPNLREMVYSTRPTTSSGGRRIIDPKPRVSAVAQAINCPWCAPMWMAAVATLVADASFGLVWPVMWWLALSSAVGLLGRAEGK